MTGNERAIVAAALHWHTAHARRLAIGADKRRWDKAAKEDGSVFSHASAQAADAAARLTPAKRVELAALRALGKACANERGSRHLVEDAALVMDVQVVCLR